MFGHMIFQAFTHEWFESRDNLIGDITLVRFYPPVELR